MASAARLSTKVGGGTHKLSAVARGNRSTALAIIAPAINAVRLGLIARCAMLDANVSSRGVVSPMRTRIRVLETYYLRLSFINYMSQPLSISLNLRKFKHG